jgi:hypothetical protein
MLTSACGGSAKPSHTAAPSPTEAPPTTHQPGDYSAQGIYYGPGFSLPLPSAPKVRRKPITLNNGSTTATFYEATNLHYEVLVMTAGPIVARPGKVEDGLATLMRSFWSLNGPALRYTLRFDPLEQVEGAPSLPFSGKGASGTILGQAVLAKGTVYVVAIRADSPKPFQQFQSSLLDFHVT